ncbi:MAG: tripartite tricarboxylate transporter substrate binding protein [Burkholderiales bacterium]|nr:tripartite tricarboxylate transporter substrate binding protein [Burkholderiales bacterium]MDP2399424.1 tripartite tricarboxylate transporter substrate binding protein [Burkholderiales bacterium]
MNKIKYLLFMCVCTSSLAITAPSFAQSFPAKPIRLILPYPPGGGSDTIARPFARKMSENIGQQVIVDNRGGAGGNIGMEAAARSAPDGYTVVMGLTAQLAVNPGLYRKLPYDPVRDFEPITLLANGAYLLVAHPSLPVKSLRDVITIAKKRPGELFYASSGNGSGAHLASELLNTMAGISIVHVPYKGGGPALVDTISGQTQLLFATPIASAGHLQAGRLRAIAVSTTKRVNSMPDVPTAAESGLPGYDSGVWYGMLAPKGTPREIVARLNEEFRKVLADPGIRDFLTKSGVEPEGSSPEELGKYMRSEIDKWAKVIKTANIRLD